MSASSSARSGNAVPETIDSTSRPPTIPLRASSASISAPNGNMVQPRLETLPSTSRLPATTLHVSGSQCSAPSGNVTRPQAKSAGIVKPETIKDEDEDDIIIVTSSGLKSPNYLTPVPEGRRKELEAFPEFVPNVGESAVFSRGFLSATLGGNTQSLIVQIALQKSLAKSCNVKKFLCPNQSQNPWCPRAPGEHGYMFVGLGNERDTFREPEQLHLFLSVPPSKSKALDVTYLGFYEVSRVAELTVDEWGTLSPTVQGNYASTTANRQSSKNQAKPPVAPIRAEYDSGARQVPCVRLRCIGFDEALYAGLVAANSPGLSNNKRRSDADSPYPKRPRREEDVA
ncbi:hypothetical protein K438DRAFT_626161 [Mycena galopus ATCC 62051]|nr:hypothetical protein K438DRAFT_626161 [Mycena galopus ATCC 62051]